MATSPHLVAGGDIRPARFVKLSASADHTGLEADANERSIGIAGRGTRQPPLSDYAVTALHAAAGDPITLAGDGEETLLEYGDTITAGALLKSDADGKGVPVASSGATQQFVGAVALEDGAAGVLGRVQVKQYSFYPALS